VARTTSVLKIVAIERAEGRAVLQLEGQLIGPWIDELERACAARSARDVALDLAHVAFVERRGVELLRSLGARGVPLLHCSAFVAEQLKARG
jgi:anti-anti-sigma regulatory factor